MQIKPDFEDKMKLSRGIYGCQREGKHHQICHGFQGVEQHDETCRWIIDFRTEKSMTMNCVGGSWEERRQRGRRREK